MEKCKVLEFLPSECNEDKEKERRIWPRQELRARVIIKSKPDVFFSHIENLSMGGISLEDELPESFREQPCDVQITYPHSREKICLRAEVLNSATEGRRLRFLHLTITQTFQLHDLLGGSLGLKIQA